VGGFFVRELIGLNDRVLARLRKKRIGEGGSESATPLYQDVGTMAEFNLTPGQWHRLGSVDKKILHYFRLMREYHLDVHVERSRQQSGQPASFMTKMPQLRR